MPHFAPMSQVRDVRRVVVALGALDRGATVPLDVLELFWILDRRTAPAVLFADGGKMAADLALLAQDLGPEQDVVPETLVAVAAAEFDGDHRALAERLLRRLIDAVA